LEIHAPHRPIHTAKEMMVHLGLITLGVLIALSFEGLVGWREHRALVREARANILSETRDNQKELANRLQKIQAEREAINDAIAVAQRLQDTKTLEGKVQLGFVIADLRDASRSTAAVTGAFGLMAYNEVRKYAAVYGHQELFLRAQTEGMQNLTRALAAVGLLEHPETATVRELEDWRMTLRLTLASLEIEEQLGGSLLKEYEHMLQGHDQ
jgi:chemotaxis protein histidine kinase CheA